MAVSYRAAVLGFAVASAVAACVPPARAQAPAPPANQPPAPPTPTPTPTPAPPPAAEEPFIAVRLSGLVQVDTVLWNEASVDEIDPSTGEPLNEDCFVLRRARIRVDAERGVLRGHLTLDANTLRGPVVRVLSAELGVGWPPAPELPNVLAALGLFLIPFGFETNQPAAGRLFLEPSQWVRALFPGRRDLGARVQSRYAFLRAQVALVNGNPTSSAAFPLRDPNAAKDVVGRVGVEGDLWSGLRVRAGASLMFGRGFHAGRGETKDTLVWRDSNEDGVVQSTELQVIAGSPAEPSANFDRYALGGDLEVATELPVLGPLGAFGEIVWAQNADRALVVADPIASGRDQRELGFAIGVRQYLTRHAEIGVRYDRYEPDRDTTDQQGPRLVPFDAEFSTWAFAAAWCSLPGFRLTLEYDRNRNPLGRSANGEPATLASDVLTLRGQLEL